MTTTKLAVWVCTLVSMSGCMAVVQGNGVPREETREVGLFESIHVGHGFEAVATLGSPARVTLSGDENVLPYIAATVANGHLVVDAPDGTMLMTRIPVKVTLVSPTLTGVGASGSSKVSAVASPTETFTIDASGDSRITVQGIAAERLVAGGSGLSRLDVAGTARVAEISLSGGSSVDGQHLAAEAVQLDGSGASSGMVRASQQVTGQLSGASHFTVLGRPPKLQVGTSGGSTVQLAD